MTIIDKLLKRPSRAELNTAVKVSAQCITSLELQLDQARREAKTVGKDPTGRAVVARMLDHPPLDELCRLGPNGCEAHFGERDCSVAWAKSYAGGFITSSPGAASLQLMLATVGDSFATLIKALEEYADRHEPDGAQPGAAGEQNRRRARRARELAHAARGGPA